MRQSRRIATIAGAELVKNSTARAAHIPATDRREVDPAHGFESFGEFAIAVRAAKLPGAHERDERLFIGAAAPGTAGSEGVGQDGGFAVPPSFAQDIATYAAAEDALLPLTDQITVSGNSMVFPKDETTPWGTDGLRAYWQVEATAATQTKPKLGETTLRMSKLLALAPLTDELFSDGSALTSYLPERLGAAVRWKVNEALLVGNGNGQPLGCFKGGAAVVVAKDAGQATLTVSLLNLTNMLARLPPGSFGNAVWLVQPDAIAAFIGAAPAGYPMVPAPARPDGKASSLIGLMLGRPAIANQHAAAFTSQGDLSLVDLSWVRTISHLVTTLSLDFFFDADVAAYRVSFRVDGAPKIAAALTPAKGSNSLSPFIQLAAR